VGHAAKVNCYSIKNSAQASSITWFNFAESMETREDQERSQAYWDYVNNRDIEEFNRRKEYWEEQKRLSAIQTPQPSNLVRAPRTQSYQPPTQSATIY
jgi:hypothetical protein